MNICVCTRDVKMSSYIQTNYSDLELSLRHNVVVMRTGAEFPVQLSVCKLLDDYVLYSVQIVSVMPHGGIHRSLARIWRYRKPGGGKYEIAVRNGFYLNVA